MIESMKQAIKKILRRLLWWLFKKECVRVASTVTVSDDLIQRTLDPELLKTYINRKLVDGIKDELTKHIIVKRNFNPRLLQEEYEASVILLKV